MTWKQRAKRALDHPVAGAPARAAFTALATAQLARAARRDRRAVGLPTPEQRADTAEHVTIAVKTFMRPATCRRFIRSARTVFDGRVIVVDDSRTPMTPPDDRVDVVPLPFNSGVPVGRNLALSMVDTEFTLVTDDDHVFTAATQIHRAVEYLRATPEVDIVGLALVGLPQNEAGDLRYPRMVEGTLPPLREDGEVINGLPVRLMVAQNYVARTESLRRIGWDEGVRMTDHKDFFHRASGRLVTVIDLGSGSYHVRTPFNKEYMSYRDDVADDGAYLTRKWAAVAAGEIPSDTTCYGGSSAERRAARGV